MSYYRAVALSWAVNSTGPEKGMQLVFSYLPNTQNSLSQQLSVSSKANSPSIKQFIPITQFYYTLSLEACPS